MLYTSQFLDPTTSLYPAAYIPQAITAENPILAYYATQTAGVGLTNPRVYTATSPGTYISNTPVADGEDHVQATPAPAGLMFYDLGRYDYWSGIGQTLQSQTARIFFYNPNPVAMACLVWLASPDPELLGVLQNGQRIYDMPTMPGAYTDDPHPSRGGVPVSQSSAHLPSGSCFVWHEPGTSSLWLSDSGSAYPGTYNLHGPYEDDPLVPIPVSAHEFVLNPLCCWPITITQKLQHSYFNPDRDSPFDMDLRIVLQRKVAI